MDNIGKIAKASLLNDYSAADIDTTSSPGFIVIPGLLPIPVAGKIAYQAIDKKIANVEVVQVFNVGKTTPPVIEANTKYQIKLGNTGNRREGAQSQLKAYGYTSPTILTGNPTIDRYNAYTSLSSKINQPGQNNFITAYPVESISYDGQTVNFTVGSVVTGGTSGAKGIILADLDGGATGTLTIALTTLGKSFVNNEALTDAAGGAAVVNKTIATGLVKLAYDAQTVNFTVGATVTGGTSNAYGVITADVDGGATGTLTVKIYSGVFVDNEALTDSSGGAAVANIPGGVEGEVVGLYMQLVDVGNYYNDPIKLTHRGPNTVLLTAGFVQSVHLELLTAGVVQFGVGTRLLRDVPTTELTSANLATGTWDFTVQNLPIAGQLYTCIFLKYNAQGGSDAKTDGSANIILTQSLWLREGDADYAATVAAVAAL